MIVKQVRSGRVEAQHRVHAVFLGDEVTAWGEPRSAYARSSLKPFQVEPFAALAPSLGLSDKHVALACGSHNAEQPHLDGAAEILDACGLDASALQCGVHAQGPHAVGEASLLHNNCSGKHAGMLAVCVDRGWSLDYLDPEHPLQARLRADLEARVGAVGWGVDGCGLPTAWMEVRQLALLFQNLQPGVLAAMHAHPFMVAGTQRVDTAVMESAPVVTKIGAMGVMAGVHLETGHAFALHVEDGDERARDAAGMEVMRHAGWLEPIPEYANARIKNHAGVDLGSYRV